MAETMEREAYEEPRGGEGRARAHEERPVGRDQRPVAGLLRELAGETTALVRGEVELAKSEVKDGLSHLQKGAVSAATGGAVLHAGLLTLLAAGVFALALIWPLWLAALVIGGGVTIIGIIMAGAGKAKLKPKQLKPERTLQSMERDRELARVERDRAKEKLQ